MGGCQETGTGVGGSESIKDGDKIIWILFGGGYMTLWASLVAQSVKYPPAMQETWVQSLGWGDLLKKGTATKNKDHGIQSHHFMANRCGNSERLYFLGLQNHCRR